LSPVAPGPLEPVDPIIPSPQPPTDASSPTISGTDQRGQTLTASPGSWSGSPTSFAYAWQRCDAAGANCAAIAAATAVTYTLTEADVGATLRVAVTASNEVGPSSPASSAQTGLVGTPVQHLEYVVQDGVVSVYDMDQEFKLVKTISLPSTKDEVRGVTVAPSTHVMYVMHGGDGPNNGSGNGSVLAYDLVQEKVLWDVKLSTGIDSGQVSPDATKLYIPTGENTSSGIWNVLSAATGALLGTIQGGSGAHNTVVSNDGRYVYLGGRNYNFLDVYETETGKVKEIGPLIGTVRPLTVNGPNTLAFTTATGFDGFQVSSISTGKVLFTVSFGEVPNGFPFTGPSHGISLSPDERQVYVIDAVHKEVQFWDVSKVNEGIAPTQIGVVPIAGLSGTESPCAYECGRGGWVQLSRDGRFLFVGDSGEVIETATRQVVTTLPTLSQTKKSIEVDWQNGLPIATSGRTGVGYLE
jgi:6-phosphogluconolactonase (cycloisomerase 2 family)